MQHLSYYVVLGCTACTILGGLAYFRHYTVSRPPIGVFTLKDIAIMSCFIILVPFLYLVLPLWLAAVLLLLATLSILYFTFEPVLHSRWLVWLAVLILLAAEFGAALLFGTRNNAFFIINNAVLVVVIIGISNLWAQSGMKARDATVLGAFLAVYDFIATSQLPLMSDLITRLSNLPFAPLLAWGSGSAAMGIGLGDVLLATVFPLVMYKAFGRQAGITAIVLALVSIGTLLALPLTGVFPVMVVLGPLMVLQYLFWSRRRGRERTMWQYLQEEPLQAHELISNLRPEAL
jgi:hypothetical protein